VAHRGERAALKRSYGIGQGAFYAKHLAAADPFIAYRFAHDIVRTARAAAGAAIRGRGRESRGHLAFLGGLFTGAWRMGSTMASAGRRTPDASADHARTAAPRRPARASAGAGGRILEKDLATGDISPPALEGAELAYVIFRWKGRPVGRLIVERGRELSDAAFRSAAFEASAAGSSPRRSRAPSRPLIPIHPPRPCAVWRP
jgi:hypothetical protein